MLVQILAFVILCILSGLFLYDLLFLLTVIFDCADVHSFSVASLKVSIKPNKLSNRAKALTIDDPSNMESLNPVNPGIALKIKGKTLNFWGILYGLTTFSVALVVLPFMILLAKVCDLRGRQKVHF